MPKQTFFNLSEDKKENLIIAAKKEFSRVPLNEALISNIVKTAGISRGSFYQYFEDKEDVFFYLLDEYSKENKANFILHLKKADGDLFETFIEMFHAMLKKFEDKERRDFFRNAFLNMNHKIEHTFTKNFDEERFQQELLEIENHINKKNINISDEQQFFYVLEILMAVTFHNLIQSFAKELPFEVSMKNYTYEIELLKRGLYKEIE